MRRTEMNTDIIGEGQTGGRGEPLHAAEMTRRGSNRQFGRQFDRVTTSLTPYGMSFWALILAACGGGGGRAVNTEVLDEGFVPEAGMEELGAPLNEFL